MTIYAMAVIVGPLVAPLVGSAFATTEGLGWRWTEYVRKDWDFTLHLLTV
jgi:MFS family permease